MKKFVIQSIFLILVILGLIYIYFNPGAIPFVPQPTTQKAASLGATKLNIEVADKPQVRSKGLGGRVSLATDSGMLFIFEKVDRYPFWMKGLAFSLDFIYLKENKIVDFIKNVPPPVAGQKDETLSIYLPNQSFDMVLEVNGGFIDSHGLQIGDQLEVLN